MLWPICDDHGRTRAASRMLASLLFPYDDDAAGLIGGWLDELEREGCIQRYESGGSTYLHIPKWLIHQKIDKPSKPVHPEPPEALAKPREDSGLEGKGKEGKGEERARTFSQWVDALDGAEAIPADHAVFAYAVKVGIPSDFLTLAWAWFEKTYGPEGRSAKKKYIDWPAVFRNAVDANWPALWYFADNGECRLTTKGLQLQREVAA
jgi:hypothetical protein